MDCVSQLSLRNPLQSPVSTAISNDSRPKINSAGVHPKTPQCNGFILYYSHVPVALVRTAVEISALHYHIIFLSLYISRLRGGLILERESDLW